MPEVVCDFVVAFLTASMLYVHEIYDISALAC